MIPALRWKIRHPIRFPRHRPAAIKDDAFHGPGGSHSFFAGMVLISLIEGTLKIAQIIPKPSAMFVQESRTETVTTYLSDFLRAICRRYGIARFFVVVGQNWGELFQYNVCGKFVPLYHTRTWETAPHIAGADRIVPLPAGEFAILRMIGHKALARLLRLACHLLEHGKLVRIDGSVFVHTALDVPPGEVAPVRSRKCSGANPPTGAPCQ